MRSADARLLLDTCAWLDWALGARIRAAVLHKLERAAGEGRAYLSPLSVQETMRLAEKGRLDLRPTPLSWVKEALRRMRLQDLDFTREAALEAGCLTDVNGDPVDRALLGSALVSEMTLVTRDDDLLAAARKRRIHALDTR